MDLFPVSKYFEGGKGGTSALGVSAAKRHCASLTPQIAVSQQPELRAERQKATSS